MRLVGLDRVALGSAGLCSMKPPNCLAEARGVVRALLEVVANHC